MITTTYNENTHKLVPLSATDEMVAAARACGPSATKREYYEHMLAAAPSPVVEQRPELTVWEDAMPESNGKSNFTAVLHRKAEHSFDIFTNGFQFARSEYPDRVKYEADFMRWLIGERAEQPELWDKCYDMDKHSGYTQPSNGVTSPANEVCHNIVCDDRCSFPSCMGPERAAVPAQAGTIDTPEFRTFLGYFTDGDSEPFHLYVDSFVAFIDAHCAARVQAAKQDGREQADKWRNLTATQREALDVARATNAINADLARAEGRLEGLEQAAERIDSANDSAGDRAAYENRDMICCETERMQALTHAAELVRALATQPSPKPEGGA